MKIGIIILFYNNEKKIDSIQFKNCFHQIKNMEMCFVNNGSKDRTLQMLKFIKDENKTNIHLLDIKKHIKSEAAIRAGARYFYTIKEFNCIGYVKAYHFNNFNMLNNVLKTVDNYHNIIIADNFNNNKKNEKIERKSTKKIFSVVEKIKQLKMDASLKNIMM